MSAISSKASDGDNPQREWLVYVNTTYYPWADIVTAATAEEAANYYPESDHLGGLIVMPFDPAIGYVRESYEGEINGLRDEGQRSKEGTA